MFPKILIIQKQLKVIDKPKQVEYGNQEEIEFDEDPPKRFYKSPSDSRRFTYPAHLYTDYERSHDPYHRYEQPPPLPPTTSTTTTTTTTPAPPNIQYVIPVLITRIFSNSSHISDGNSTLSDASTNTLPVSTLSNASTNTLPVSRPSNPRWREWVERKSLRPFR